MAGIVGTARLSGGPVPTLPSACRQGPSQQSVAAAPQRRVTARRHDGVAPCPRPDVSCRVTNTSDEIYKQQKMRQIVEDEEIAVNQEQVLYPELGSLQQRVSKFYLDELFANEGPDLEETAYWFHTPPGGWKREPAKYKAATEAPVTFADPSHQAWEAEGRVPMSTLSPGQTLTGTISDIWLHHGLQIDFGCEFDGVVPITQDQWMSDGMRETLMPGETVTCTVHALRQPGLYRWPVQLALVEPAALVDRIMPPHEYQPPISHAWASDRGWGIEEIVEATGRDYEPSTYVLPQDIRTSANEMQRVYGYDVENEDSMDLVNTLEERAMYEYVQEISHLASQEPLEP